MTIDDKKQWLGRYREADRRIKGMEEELQRWHDRAESVTKPLSDMPRGGKGKNPLEDAVEHIWDISKEINDTIAEMRRIQAEIESAIDAVDNGTYRTLLRLRYINLKKWEQIAVDMDYDYYHTRKYLHKKALKCVKLPPNTP